MVGAVVLGGCLADGQTPVFTLSSPDLASGTFAPQYILNGFGCSGRNISPEVDWKNLPAGTKSLALQVYDPDAPSGSGFWHWAVYDIPPDTNGLARGAGNNLALLPLGAFGGTTDFFDTGVIGANGNYGGPCPPAETRPTATSSRCMRLSVDKLEVAGGVPENGNGGAVRLRAEQGVSAPPCWARASFTATYGRQ